MAYNTPAATAHLEIMTSGPNRVISAVSHYSAAPPTAVWSFLRRFDAPQVFRSCFRSCRLIQGNGVAPGSLRQVHADTVWAIERLDRLDEANHIMGCTLTNSNSCWTNYRWVTTLHPSPTGFGTIILETFAVDNRSDYAADRIRAHFNRVIAAYLQQLAERAEELDRGCQSIEYRKPKTKMLENGGARRA